MTDVGDPAFPPLLDIGVVVADGHGVFTIPWRDGPRDVAFAEVGVGDSVCLLNLEMAVLRAMPR